MEIIISPTAKLKRIPKRINKYSPWDFSKKKLARVKKNGLPGKIRTSDFLIPNQAT